MSARRIDSPATPGLTRSKLIPRAAAARRAEGDARGRWARVGEGAAMAFGDGVWTAAGDGGDFGWCAGGTAAPSADGVAAVSISASGEPTATVFPSSASMRISLPAAGEGT